jgi:phage tail-like protein
MFKPDEELLHVAGVTSYRFHATIGLDPLGNFQEIDGLGYEVPAFEYKELGRNHGPWKLPFGEGPASPGELTLKWGMIVRSKLYDWIHDVKLGKDFLKDVWIFQLSHKAIPLRIYHLSGCWPIKWESGAFSASGPAELATESVTLAYDNVDMANVSALAMLGDLVDEPVAALVDKLRPRKGYTSEGRSTQHQRLPGTGGYKPLPGADDEHKWRKYEAKLGKDLEKKKFDRHGIEKEDAPTIERFQWEALEQKELGKWKVGKPPKALDRIAFDADDHGYGGAARWTDDRLPLESIYEAYGGSHFADPLADAYVALGADGTGEVEEGEAYAAEGGEAVAVGEGMKTEKEEGDA